MALQLVFPRLMAGRLVKIPTDISDKVHWGFVAG